MIPDYLRMRWWRLAFLGFALAAGCTERNARYCGDGVCIDPAFPFCDFDGALEGAPKTCIAVACTPDEHIACRGDQAITCNATGTNYDLAACSLGCSDASAGCRLCEPNQTACTNGKVATCDANGEVTSSQDCILGCFEDEPRCRQVAPSNGLAPYLDMAASAPDVTLDNATLLIPSGMVTSSAGTMTLTSMNIPAPPNGVAIQAFPIRSLTIIGDLQIRGSFATDVPAVAFLVHGDVNIDGIITLVGSGREESIRSTPGSVTSGPCVGAIGMMDIVYIAGSGGGGSATQGGSGGSHYMWPGSPGGSAFPNPDLQPLRGGCRGGGPPNLSANHGGGAIQITSGSRIRLGPNSKIQANGSAGFLGMSFGAPQEEAMPKGGGSGGGILLEAPIVTIESGSVLAANGGGGAAGGHGEDGSGIDSTGALPSLGGVCTNPDACTNGGDGGSSSGPARTAASIPTPDLQQVYTGAGGGSVGHIRINTKTGVYVKANDAQESPAASAGSLATR